jgi:hypothetical protein
MREATTVLSIIRERGQRGLPLEGLYRQLYNPDLYFRAYAKLYPNKGALTPGATPETVDGMTRRKIEAIIAALRSERYCWTPVRRTYRQKKNGKLRPLGIPSWSDKLLQLELSEEKTLITHARTEKAHFLGYELHTFQANDKHDRRGRRCVNGGIGLCVPTAVIHAHCALYRNGQRSRPFLQRVHDSAYTIVTQYQAEYRGIVEYYRLAYNLRRLQRLKWVMESSLTRTLAMKFKTSCRTIHQRLQTVHHTKDGTYKVLEVQVDRGPQRPPLVARFGGITLRWNRQAPISELPPKPIWSGRSEVVERLLAETCEVCGATDDIEVHHLRKLSDLDRPGHAPRPKWVKIMATRRRKTLVVCQACHHAIHSGRYDGPALSAKTHGRAD